MGVLEEREGIVAGVDPLDWPPPRPLLNPFGPGMAGPLHAFPLANLERSWCDGGREELQQLPSLATPSTFTQSTQGLAPSLSDPLRPADAMLLDMGAPEFPPMRSTCASSAQQYPQWDDRVFLPNILQFGEPPRDQSPIPFPFVTPASSTSSYRRFKPPSPVLSSATTTTAARVLPLFALNQPSRAPPPAKTTQRHRTPRNQIAPPLAADGDTAEYEARRQYQDGRLHETKTWVRGGSLLILG